MDSAILKFKAALKEAHCSATKSREQIFTHLLQHGPLHVSTLATGLGDSVDRATVYRTIELFEKLGIVNRIWHGFKNHVELSEIFTPHHHHALCQHCGRTIDITSSELEATLATLAKQHGFLAMGHSVELVGYCEECQG